MPYSSNGELPSSVRADYSDRCQSVWRRVFNEHYPDGEGTARRLAYTAANRCKESGKAMTDSKAEPLDPDELDAWFAGKRPRALLAIPFTGPIKGRDLDGDRFTERTDIKPHWFTERAIDWHHGEDSVFGRAVIGKADNLRMEEDGWWVDTWLKHGERRLNLVRRLIERGGEIMGSSESIRELWRKNPDGEITVWPYWRQTFTTSPQNTLSRLAPAKAALSDVLTTIDDQVPTEAFWAELSALADALGSHLSPTSRGEETAKAGRVLSARNEQALRSALDQLTAVLNQLQKEDTADPRAVAARLKERLNH